MEFKKIEAAKLLHGDKVKSRQFLNIDEMEEWVQNKINNEGFKREDIIDIMTRTFQGDFTIYKIYYLDNNEK